jgi:flagellar motor switch protein FliN/FliY
MAPTLSRYALLPLPVDAELGRCSMPVRDILSLAPGSIIKLSNAVGSQIDLRVGGAPFGAGEIISISQSIAVRILSFKNRKGE